MLFSWLQRRRRQQLLAAPCPPQWEAILEANVHHYRRIEPQQQARLRDWVRIFVAEKHWTGCGGLDLTDEIRVTIAGNAGLLALGTTDFYFDKVQSLLVYPDDYRRPDASPEGELVDEEAAFHGEAWHRGPIVLSWREIRRNIRSRGSGRNLVLHELAHHLDDLDGSMGGTPPLENRRQYDRWQQVMSREYDELVESVQRGWPTLIDSYGATSRAEFFAVTTECFYERPIELYSEHEELYELLAQFYRLDPAEWFARPLPPALPRDELR